MRTGKEQTSPGTPPDERAARLRHLRVVVASDPIVSEPPPPSVDAPEEDYVIIGRLFDTVYVDPKVAARGRVSRLAARVLGDPTVVAFRAVRTGRKADAIIAMG